MNIKRNKILLLSFALFLFVTSAGFSISNAVDIKENKEKIENINKNIEAIKKKLKEGKEQEAKLANKVDDLKGKIAQTEKEIEAIEQDINSAKVKINKAEQELREAERNISVQDENLSKRFRSMYKNGVIGFVDVVLGANSVEDMVSNIDMVQKIYDNDQQVLKDMKLKHEMIAEKKRELSNLKESLDKKQQKNKIKQGQLNSQKVAVAAEEKKVKEKNDQMFSHIEQLSKDSATLEAEIIRATSSFSEQYPNIKFVGGGNYQWPLDGYRKISSPFGYRIHPIYKTRRLHTGLDIPSPSGTPVRASRDGVVVKSGWAGSYGNLVVLYHGNNIATAYAHNSSLVVSKGQTVKRGQVISKVGSTGASTGAHLHFEVRQGGSPVNPLGYVKP